jgi:hypothetical protein
MGVNSFISKPIVWEILSKEIDNLLNL